MEGEIDVVVRLPDRPTFKEPVEGLDEDSAAECNFEAMD